LSASTRGLLKVLGVKESNGSVVTEEEIQAILVEGHTAGVIESQSTPWCATCSVWTIARSAR
jgi:putative hemolysin